jgi:hypothetical protein
MTHPADLILGSADQLKTEHVTGVSLSYPQFPLNDRGGAHVTLFFTLS